MIGFAKLISEHRKRQLEDVDIVAYANLIRDAAKHLLAVLNDILDISKMRAARTPWIRATLSSRKFCRLC